ncbi:three-helix bundle dimerization domain-containing protein [Streptomyces sp. NPDC048002]|uniref:three-helix bundle dimerization domain-containing protein n=1 Tax=Streptomyces sp. NPDC048002 TaxID=3154344 RepID=UPI0033CB9E1D
MIADEGTDEPGAPALDETGGGPRGPLALTGPERAAGAVGLAGATAPLPDASAGALPSLTSPAVGAPPVPDRTEPRPEPQPKPHRTEPDARAGDDSRAGDEGAVLRDLTDRLCAGWPGADRAGVEAEVRAAYDAFREARVRAYVPILVERRVRRRLAGRPAPDEG